SFLPVSLRVFAPSTPVPYTTLFRPDRQFGIPALGTMAHSWVQVYPSEYEAFRAYAETYPDNCTLLVDTYNVLHSGIPNAIRVFRSEEHTSELQSRFDLVCRLLLENT